MYIFILLLFSSSRQDSPHINTFNFACTAWELLGLFYYWNWTLLKKHDSIIFSWQVGGEFFSRRYAPHSTLEMRHCYSVLAERWRVSLFSSSLSRFLVPKSQVLGMNRAGWAPVEGRPQTSPEMWHAALRAFPCTQVSALCLPSYGHSALHAFLPSLL